MKNFRSFAVLTLLLPIIGIAQAVPARAVPASAVEMTPLISSQSTKLQKVDCRRYVHTHRRCTLWRGGYCQRWVTYTHRCG